MKKALPFLALTLLMSGPAAAEPLNTVPAKLNPGKAYILVEYKLTANPMSNFPGSRRYAPLTVGLSFARYDPVSGDIRGLGKAKDNPVPAKQLPTESFRNRELEKGEGARLFLIEVEPDLWVVQGWGTTSFSLGSYTFKLEPGTVTDLGVVTSAADWADGDHPATTGDIMKMALLGAFAKRPAMAPARLTFRPRTAGDMPLPALLPPDRIRPVAFSPGARFGNYLGGTVNRIEGVNALAKDHAADETPHN
jgi:hypothetical protein